MDRTYNHFVHNIIRNNKCIHESCSDQGRGWKTVTSKRRKTKTKNKIK